MELFQLAKLALDLGIKLNSTVVLCALIVYMIFHYKDHDNLEKSRNSYKEGMNNSMSEVKTRLEQISKTLTKYVLKFESEDSHVHMERMEKILDFNRDSVNNNYYKVKSWILKNHDFNTPKYEYVERVYAYCMELLLKRYEELSTILDPSELLKIKEVDRVILPYFKELLRFAIPSLLNKELNGTRDFTIDAVLSKVTSDVLKEWEKLFKNSYND